MGEINLKLTFFYSFSLLLFTSRRLVFCFVLFFGGFFVCTDFFFPFVPLASALEFTFSDVSINFWRLELPVGGLYELSSEVDSARYVDGECLLY